MNLFFIVTAAAFYGTAAATAALSANYRAAGVPPVNQAVRGGNALLGPAPGAPFPLHSAEFNFRASCQCSTLLSHEARRRAARPLSQALRRAAGNVTICFQAYPPFVLVRPGRPAVSV